MTRSIISDLKLLLGLQVMTATGEHAHPFVVDSRGDFHGECQAICFPETKDDVVSLVKYAQKNQISLVPQGGNTGRAGGATPLEKDSILVNMSRLNRILDINPLQYSMVVESGCVLQDIIDYADRHNLFFPLSLGSQTHCQIGGNVATNAGGVHVVKYGMTRDLVAGLEVVLPNGEIWDGIRYPIKGNMGYDLKHLFMGSEGTLGFITKVSLKLFPRVRSLQSGIFSFPSFADVLAFYQHLKAYAGDFLQTFEIMPQKAIKSWELEVGHSFFEKEYSWAVLAEVSSSSLLEETFFLDVVSLCKTPLLEHYISQKEDDIQSFWRLRHGIVSIQKRLGTSIKHDISIPVMFFDSFMNDAEKSLLKLSPDLEPYPFGHLGDGNIHYNVFYRGDMSSYNRIKEEVHRIVYDLVLYYKGHISAEHGIGRIKREHLEKALPRVEIDMMKQIKKSLDPQGIMNPCVLL